MALKGRMHKSDLALTQSTVLIRVSITCPKLCQNGGNCVFNEQSNDYECQCPVDFNGQFCEQKAETWLGNNTCLSQACLNHGTCDPVTGICKCVFSFAGDFCELEILSTSTFKAKNLPQCDKIQCQNGGICSNITASLFQCLCPENFLGRYCEISTTARNSCPAGFTGAQCVESTVVSFYGDSLFAYLIPVDLRHPEFEFSLEFEFRTVLTDTILAVGESIFGKEFCLAILDGRLSLFVGKKRLINLHNFHINGRNWYRTTLKINFTSSYAFLALYEEGEIVDLEKTTIEQRVRMSPIFVIKFGGVGEIFLNGENDGDEARYEPFVGCLYDIVVNGLLVYPRHFKGSSVVNVGYECPINKENLCLNNPCTHHGKCQDLLLKSVCVCDRPFYGSFCEMVIQEATFGHQSTESYVEIILNHVDSRRLFARTPFDLSFFVRTRQKNATLFIAGGAKNPIDSTINFNDAGHFVWIGLVNGRLCFELKRTKGRNSEQISNASSPRLNDGFENFVEIQIDKDNRVLATLNSSLLIWKENLDNAYSYQPPTTNLYIGGYAEKIQNREKRFFIQYQPYFKGTLRDVRINNHLIELLPGKIIDKNLNILAATLLHRNVLSGTVSDDTCKSDPCMNNGTCHVTFNDFLCDCMPGYFGRRCQFQDNCYNATCPTDSKCINLETGAICSGSSTLSARNSLLAFSVQMLDQNSGESPDHMTMQFELRTRNVDGHLLSIVGHSGSLLMQILLSKGLLVLHLFDNMTQNHIVNSGLSINNGDWKKISMYFGQNSRLILEQTEISLTHVHNVLSLKSLKLIFGGQWELGFDGCIRNVSLLLDDGYPVDDEEQEDTDRGLGVKFEMPFIMSKYLHEYAIGKFSVKVQKYEISDGCSGREVCRESLCQNNSTCLDVFNSYRCLCGLGFSGPLCE
uniref:Uncharacterized protein n=1 Tax=Romanomermis culicivorax TaxID=13658 RepID=A0A915IYQ3_ROMCU